MNTEEVRVLARELGFDRVGVRAVTPSEHIDTYRSWVEQGLHGEMAYLERDDAVARRGDPAKTLASVRTAIVVSESYLHSDPGDERVAPSHGVIARYARGRDYHKVVKKRLLKLLDGIRSRTSHPVEGRVYVDTGPLLEREFAQGAGLGWFGKNTMLIHPDTGSYLFLGVLLLDRSLEPDPPFEADRCGSCRACIDACPTDALLGRDASGAPIMDARRCISYLTIELRGSIPVDLRPAIGNRIYGCDICQEVCPWNRSFGLESSEDDFRARGEGPFRPGRDRGPPQHDVASPSAAHPWLPGTDSPRLVDLMRMTYEEWDLWTRGSAIRRAGYAGLRRNVAVAIGNWLSDVDDPPEEAIRVLRTALDDEEPVVREHAAWALERAEGSSSISATRT